MESHRGIPNAANIVEIKDKIVALRENVQRKIHALDQLSEDLAGYLRGEKKYAEYGFSTNPFVFTVPPEYPKDIVDQEVAQEKMTRFVGSMIEGSTKNFVFLIADEGMGKTHTLNFFAKNINEGKFGKAIALRLNCRPRSDIIDLYPQIHYSMSNIPRSEILGEEVIRILETSGVPKSITDFLRILRTINSHLITAGCKGVFLMIDDFENTLPSTETAITPRSILQLSDLARLENIGFIIAIREKYWKNWIEDIRTRIPRIRRTDIIRLKKFTPKETSELINFRLSEYKDLKETKKPPVFNLDVTSRICRAAKGVPRAIITIAREVFRLAVGEDTEITVELLKEASS